LIVLSAAGILLFISGKAIYFYFAVRYLYLAGNFGLKDADPESVTWSVKFMGGFGKALICLGLACLAAVAFIFLQKAFRRLVEIGVTPPSRMMIGLVSVLCGFLCLMQFHVIEVILDVTSLSSSPKWKSLQSLIPFFGILQLAGASLFLISAVMIYTGVRDTAREMRLAHPGGLHWTLKAAYFALGAGGLSGLGLPIFHSGTYVHGGREFMYYMLFISDVVLIIAATLVAVFAYAGAYSIPEREPESDN